MSASQKTNILMSLRKGALRCINFDAHYVFNLDGKNSYQATIAKLSQSFFPILLLLSFLSYLLCIRIGYVVGYYMACKNNCIIDYLKDLLIGKTPEPIFIVILTNMVPADQTWSNKSISLVLVD